MPTPLDWLLGLESFGMKFGLAGMRTIMDGLGHPELACPTVHIAGTNGKGSVTAIVHAGLRHAGWRAARYTSPHLLSLAERFVVGDHPLERSALERSLDRVRQVIDAGLAEDRLAAHPTFFEVATAVAFDAFREAGAEAAVIEVGLGGSLDATNVVRPVATAITSIAFDHEAHLGRTLAAIAAEKAGTLKAGVPAVIGAMPAEALSTIRLVAADVGAPLVLAHDGARAERVSHGATQRIRLVTPERDYGVVDLALAGAHQVENALVAVRVLETLGQRGVRMPADAVVTALATVTWPGRLDHRRFAGGREALFDAAHNPAGAATLASYLAELGSPARPLVFAAMGDKDIAGMLRALLPQVSSLIVTRSHSLRAAAPEAIAEQARALAPGVPVVTEPDVARALAAAWQQAPSIVVAGSIFLLADVFRELGTS